MLCLSKTEKEQGTAVALGYFDGIHLGHMAVLGKTLAIARERNLIPVVMLFDIHPRKLLTGKVPPMLLTEERKRLLLEKMGFKVVDFDFRHSINFSPEEFEDKVLGQELSARAVVCGYDYRYGKDGKGNSETLIRDMSKKGTDVFSLEPVYLEGEAVSSTKIRQLISEGKVKKAATMLGKPFTYDFEVIKGKRIGRKLGFPTINQHFPEDFIVPKYGVYASYVKVGGRTYSSVTNIGICPTVDGTDMRSETCIFDFDGDLYGKYIEVSLIEFLREEKKFADLEELKEAVNKDIKRAKEVYREVTENE